MDLLRPLDTYIIEETGDLDTAHYLQLMFQMDTQLIYTMSLLPLELFRLDQFIIHLMQLIMLKYNLIMLLILRRIAMLLLH